MLKKEKLEESDVVKNFSNVLQYNHQRKNAYKAQTSNNLVMHL